MHFVRLIRMDLVGWRQRRYDAQFVVCCCCCCCCFWPLVFWKHLVSFLFSLLFLLYIYISLFLLLFPQLRIGLKRLCSLHVTEREVEIIMNTMDTSQTGDVSLEEFTTCKKILAYFSRYFFLLLIDLWHINCFFNIVYFLLNRFTTTVLWTKRTRTLSRTKKKKNQCNDVWRTSFLTIYHNNFLLVKMIFHVLTFIEK